MLLVAAENWTLNDTLMKLEPVSRMSSQCREAFSVLTFPTSDRKMSSLVASGMMEASVHSVYCNPYLDPAIFCC